MLFFISREEYCQKESKPEVDGTNESTSKYVRKNDDFLLFSGVLLLAIMDY